MLSDVKNGVNCRYQSRICYGVLVRRLASQATQRLEMTFLLIWIPSVANHWCIWVWVSPAVIRKLNLGAERIKVYGGSHCRFRRQRRSAKGSYRNHQRKL